MRLRTVCLFLNLYSDRISLFPMQWDVYRLHTTCTLNSHTKGDHCIAIFFWRGWDLSILFWIYIDNLTSHLLSPWAVYRIHITCTPISHTVSDPWVAIFFLDRMRLRTVCHFLNLYSQSHLSPPDAMSCVHNHTHHRTPISHTICDPCVAIFFGEDEIEIWLSFSEFI